jgi:DNA invertase Pin-like site-specific DNA recombinase
MKTPTPSALAYSYLRFSSPAQAEGDSVRRQTALRDAWLKRNPSVRLDVSLAFQDKGVSGFKGEHRTNKRHALARFLDLVDRGRVPAGSYLIVENLDRLTREEPEVSIPKVMDLIRAGVRVVQLAPAEMVYEPGMDFGRLMMMLWELARGHGESKRKSGLSGQAKAEMKRRARADKTPHGRMCPAWLELAGGKYRVKKGAAAAVRKIFKWSAAGLGAFGVLQRLNAEGVPAIGRSGEWDRSYVRKILTGREVLGEYQPRNGGGKRTPDGDPVPGFYPAVVAKRLWYAAQAAMKARWRKSGRPATAAVNPFSGLLRCATDGEKLHVCGSRGHKYLVSAAAIQKRGGAAWRTFPLAPFTAAVLSRLRELKASELFSDPGAAKVSELTGRLEEAEKRLAVATAQWHADPESAHWQGLVSRYDLEKRALAGSLADARQEAANPVSAAWAEAVEVMARDEPDRLRALLLATVKDVWCVFARGATTAAVQVHFKGGAVRDYLIVHRRGTGGAVGDRKATWDVESEPFAAVGPLDLSRRAHARRLEAALQRIGLADTAPAAD